MYPSDFEIIQKKLKVLTKQIYSTFPFFMFEIHWAYALKEAKSVSHQAIIRGYLDYFKHRAAYLLAYMVLIDQVAKYCFLKKLLSGPRWLNIRQNKLSIIKRRPQQESLSLHLLDIFFVAVSVLAMFTFPLCWDNKLF